MRYILINSPPADVEQKVQQAFVGIAIPLPAEPELVASPPEHGFADGHHVFLTSDVVAALAQAGRCFASSAVAERNKDRYMRFPSHICNPIMRSDE
jgi:hypothetical protein